MKRRYQIDQQRAVQEFRQLAREENPNLQMIFPMTEVVGLLQEGVGHLMREAGLALMSLVMEEEVRHFAEERHERIPLGELTAGGRKPVTRGGRGRCDPANGSTRKIASAAGQLRDVPAQWADGTRGMGQADARVIDAQLRSGGERFSRSLRSGKVGGERPLHRLQPGEVAGVDGASAGRVAVVRGADRRHAVSRPADDRGSGHQC